MKPASDLFYIALFSLWVSPAQCDSSKVQLQGDSCAIPRRTIISDACVSYSDLERLNRQVKPAIDELTSTTDFFSYYRLNLFHKSCPFWTDENGMCGNVACAVVTVDNEDDIPAVWHASELSKLEGPWAQHPGRSVQKERPRDPLQGGLGDNVGESCVVEYDDECDDRDYCVAEEESESGKGDYVSLVQNPERFTGYSGEGAHMVWSAIYNENCFQRSSFPRSAALGSSPLATNPASQDFRAVLQGAALRHHEPDQSSSSSTPVDASLDWENECVEKRVFYKLMSGMHASISTHLCYHFLNQTTGQWQPNVSCYESRLHNHPDRVANLYFNYALLTRAIAKLGPHLQSYTFCTGDPSQDRQTKSKVQRVTSQATSLKEIFDESLMFKNGEGPSLKEDFRNRFRNVSRLMDCVGCDKCRLWGKLQTAGYGAALKVLFEGDNHREVPYLKRTELVALFNTYARLSGSMAALGEFRRLVGHEHLGREGEDEWEGHDENREDENEGDGDSFSELFWQELDLIIRTTKFVLREWVRGPGKIAQIVLIELNRFWEFYIGLPVSPRNWWFERPNMDEL